MTSDEFSAVKEDLKSLILTNWGERVMHFHFGCNLIEFLFENNKRDEELRSAIADRIISQVNEWLPFVEIEQLNVLFADQDKSIPDHAISVRIHFRLKHKPEKKDFLNLPVIP